MAFWRSVWTCARCARWWSQSPGSHRLSFEQVPDQGRHTNASTASLQLRCGVPDFFLFPRIKRPVKSKHFEATEGIQAACTYGHSGECLPWRLQCLEIALEALYRRWRSLFQSFQRILTIGSIHFLKLTQSYYFPDRTCVYALPPCHTVHPAQKMKFLLKMYFLGRIQHQQRKTFGKGMVFHQLSRQRLGRHTGWKKSLKKSNEKDQNLNQVKRTPQRNSGWSRLILSSSKGSGVPRYYLDTYLFKLYSMSFRYLITVEWSDSILYLNLFNCRPAKRPGQNLSLGN